MRKVILAFSALAVLGLALPAVSAPADAREVVVIKKKHHDRGHHYGWYKGKHYGWARHHRRHGAAVVVR